MESIDDLNGSVSRSGEGVLTAGGDWDPEVDKGEKKNARPMRWVGEVGEPDADPFEGDVGVVMGWLLLLLLLLSLLLLFL